MFESLKKKLKEFLGTEEQKKKSSKKKAKPQKKVAARKEVSLEKKLKKKADKIQKEVPLEFEPSTLRYEPDTEAIQEIEKKPAGFFSRLVKNINTTKLTQEQFESIFTELELLLLENNVALEVVDKIRENLEKRIVGAEMKKEKINELVLRSLAEAIETTLKEAPDLIQTIKAKQGTFTILFFGINGSGKTTSLAKIAHYLKEHGISCVMAAGDTFRAASIEQLEVHGSRLKIPVIKQTYGADPAAVAFDAKKYAEKNHIKAILIDTAGRMYTRENLMKEMEKIVRVSQPDLKLFVGESITGNDATEQARMFNETAGIDGIVLTKADVDEKGGTALSVSHVTGKPIYFLGTGQGYENLKQFKKKDILTQLGLT